MYTRIVLYPMHSHTLNLYAYANSEIVCSISYVYTRLICMHMQILVLFAQLVGMYLHICIQVLYRISYIHKCIVLYLINL